MTKKEQIKRILDNIYFYFVNEKYREAILEIEKAGKILIEELNAKTRKGGK